MPIIQLFDLNLGIYLTEKLKLLLYGYKLLSNNNSDKISSLYLESKSRPKKKNCRIEQTTIFPKDSYLEKINPFFRIYIK